MSLPVVVAILQILAMAWMGFASLEITRKQTLAKNMPWVLENPDFLHRHHRPDMRWLWASTLVCIAVVAMGPQVWPSMPFAYLKSTAILVATGLLVVVHRAEEKRIADAIPRMAQRSATFRRRSLADYAPRSLRWFADGAFAALLFALIATFAAGIVPTSFAVATGSCVAVVAVSLGWGRWAAISENSPHFQQVRMVSDKDLSENYRRFAVRLMLVLQLYIAGLLWAIVVFRIQGRQLVQNPLQDILAGWLGEAESLPAILSHAQYDVVLSLSMIPLLLYTTVDRAFADIRKIDLLGLVRREPA